MNEVSTDILELGFITDGSIDDLAVYNDDLALIESWSF